MRTQRDQIVAYRNNGHWNVLVHLVDGTVKVFTDMMAALAQAVVAIWQRRGASIAEIAGDKYLDLLLSA
jgi:hypothetical protein